MARPGLIMRHNKHVSRQSGSVRRLAAIVLLGPLTGPLALGLTHYARVGRWGMAAVCALGIAEVWLGLPAIEIALLRH